MGVHRFLPTQAEASAGKAIQLFQWQNAETLAGISRPINSLSSDRRPQLREAAKSEPHGGYKIALGQSSFRSERLATIRARVVSRGVAPC